MKPMNRMEAFLMGDKTLTPETRQEAVAQYVGGKLGGGFNLILSKNGSSLECSTIDSIVIEHFDVNVDDLKSGMFKGMLLCKYRDSGRDFVIKYDIYRVKYDGFYDAIKVTVGPDNDKFGTTQTQYVEIEIDINTKTIKRILMYHHTQSIFSSTQV